MTDPGFTVGIILLIGGLIIIAFEFVHPGAFLLIPGCVVFAAGAIYLVAPPLLTDSVFGPLIVAFAAILGALATLPYYKYLGATHPPMTTTPEALRGQVGVVLAPVTPNSMHGKVRVGSEIWSARSDKSIPVGARVKVQSGEGVCIWVQVDDTVPVQPSN